MTAMTMMREDIEFTLGTETLSITIISTATLSITADIIISDTE